MKIYQKRWGPADLLNTPGRPAGTVREALINATYTEFAERHPEYAANIGEWWYGKCEVYDGTIIVSLHAPAHVCQ